MRSRSGRAVTVLGGVAAAAAIGGLALGPTTGLAGAATTTSSSTSSTSSTSSSTSSTSSTTSTTEATTTPTAGTQTSTPGFVCVGATAADQATLNQFGAAGGFTQGADGSYSVPLAWSVTASVPINLANGQSFPVSFSANVDVSASVAKLPAGASLTVTGAPSFVVSGGGSGGPYPGSPTSGTVVKGSGPQTLPTITASGTVTGVDNTKPIAYSMATPLTSSISVTLAGAAAPVVAFSLACTSTNAQVAATNGTFTPVAAAQAKPAQATKANATFTG